MIPMFMLLLVFFQQPDSTITDTLRKNVLPIDTLRSDTLREVTVHGDKTLPVNEAIAKSLKQHPIPKAPPSLGDILNKYSPGLSDRITHPFAIKERRREKKKRKHRQILEQYDHIKTFDELLREAYWQLQQEDSLKMMKEK